MRVSHELRYAYSVCARLAMWVRLQYGNTLFDAKSHAHDGLVSNTSFVWSGITEGVGVLNLIPQDGPFHWLRDNTQCSWPQLECVFLKFAVGLFFFPARCDNNSICVSENHNGFFPLYDVVSNRLVFLIYKSFCLFIGQRLIVYLVLC